MLRNHVQVSEFCVHFSLNFSFQLYLHHLHTEENIWRYLSSNVLGLFNRGTRCQIEKGHTARVPASTSDGRAKSHLKATISIKSSTRTKIFGLVPIHVARIANGNEAKRTNFHDGTSLRATFTNFRAFTGSPWWPNLRSRLLGWEIATLLRRPGY